MIDHTISNSETKIIPLSQGKVAIVDAADYEWLSQFKWHAIFGARSWYARRNVRLPNGRRTTVYLHRVIMPPPEGMEIDHVDGDGLNNRRSNLRFATKKQNQWNAPAQSTNTSGYKGVTWHKRSRKWHAQIRVNGTNKYLGSFDDGKDAALAYDRAALKFYREFARLNFQIESE